ncbi:MAG: lysophospholipid acyltransferase family protein [Candidatus Omnitrophota bacterium]
MFNHILYRIGTFLALHLPLKAAYALAVFFSDLHYIFAFADRHAVTANLRAIFPDKPEPELNGIRRRMSRNFAKYLVDFFRFSKLDKAFIAKNIKIENINYFDEALAEGNGVIVLTAHLGNWELGGVVIGLSGYPFWVVALPHKNKKVDDFFNQQRQSKNIHVIPFGKAARQCLNLLKENKMVALVGDRDFNAKGLVVDFFGKKSYFPAGPAAFSMKTGSPIIPGFMFRNCDDSFTLRIEKPIKFEKVGDERLPEEKERRMLEIVNSYKSLIEDYIRKYPDQWYMFRRFWIG